MLKKTGNLFTTAYLFLMFGVYPLYMNQGYEDIGKAKYRFFIYSSLAAAGILACIGFMLFVQNICGRLKRRETHLIQWEHLSVTDLFVMMYVTEIVLSYRFSDYREEALWGTEGWYIGLITLVTLCVLYFLISRLWDKRELIWYIALAVSGIVFMIGILDRFSIHFIPLKVRQPSFISTLGNINWFCGYLSVLTPLGVCEFLFQGQDEWGPYSKKKKFIYGIYTMIAFMAGFCQGSSSIFLFWTALFYMLLWVAVKKKAWFSDYFLLLSMWGFSAQLVRTMRIIMPDRYNYDTDNLCAYLTDSGLTLVVGIAALVVYIFLCRKEQRFFDSNSQKIIHKIMTGLLISGVLLWLTVSVINTRAGIPGLEQMEIFLFNDAWGNGRGTAISVGFQMYREMPVLHKLFGAGPDCFSVYAYSLPEAAAQIRDTFGNNRLTNAHNELLTGLVNTGILGVSLYIGIFLSFIKRCMKRGDEDSFFYALAVCMICYFAHNLISFAQVLNLPFLFLILGMGEAAACRIGVRV